MPPKKGGKKNKNDDWDDEAAEKKLAALALDQKNETNWDDEEEVAPKPKPNKKAAPAQKKFAMLIEDDSDEGGQPPSDSDGEEPVKEEKVVEKVVETKAKKEKKEKKKGGKKGKAAEDDDLDAILASIESGAPAPAPAAPAPTPAAPVEARTETVDSVEGGETAGDDKKKKKKNKKDKKKEDAEENEEASGEPSAAPEAATAGGEDEEDNEEDEDDKEGDDKKKKKKKKNKKDKKKKDDDDDEGDKKKKGGAKKGNLSLLKEMLRKQQEAKAEQERLQKEADEQAEREEAARIEEEKAAAERKRLAKEAKQAEIERQKAAGTYMTPAQKRAHQIQMEKYKAAGVQIPTGPRDESEGPKKTFVYVDEKTRAKQEEKKRRKLLEKQGQAGAPETKEASPVEKTPEPVSPESGSPAHKSASPELKEEPIDDWEMADSDEEVKKDANKSPKKSAAPKAEAAPVFADQKDLDDSEEDEDEEESEDSEEESSEDEKGNEKGRETAEQYTERIKTRITKRREAAEAKRSTDKLRSPVICVLGHVDTGKTKMLDTIRRTNVQGGEAGGITQQIGATEVPAEAIKERCRQVRDFKAELMKIPGFLIIDTPGHESFSNLRTRGSSLCDFAILVVDIMHGLEPQTIESLKLLIKGNTPFVIALNKIDRLYGYESNPRKDVYELLKSQQPRVQAEFKERFDKIVVEFAEQSLNVALSNKPNVDSDYVRMVPTSAYLGDGIGNLMTYIVNETQTTYAQKVAYSEELDATVMEVKSIPGLGTTIDVILVNGTMKVGDVIIVTGSDGAITTQVRDLLMPKPLRDVRDCKNEYEHYKEVNGARGVKVLGKNLEKTLAGLPIFITDKYDELDYLKAEADAQLSKALHAIKKKPEGVYVQASTLGSLEALLEFLKSQKIPYSNVNIGPVHKKDIQKACAMKEHKAEFACILAFDVRVEREAQVFADKEGIKIFQADIIYHLQDAFLRYREELKQKARKDHEHLAIFPCKLRVLPQHVFNARNPIVCGVSIEAGQVKRGTQICVPSKEGIILGTVSSIERNNEEVPLAKQGEEVCIKIENTTGEAPKLYGRHFTHEDTLVSKISRESIDVCKKYFRDDLTKADWQLIVELKKALDIL